MRRWLFALMLAFGFGVAQAEIPLVLEATIQLPSSGGWDVQHWMNDSTFGWACVSGDTVLYCRGIGDSVRRYVIADVDSAWEIEVHHTGIRLLRLGSAPSHLFAVVRSIELGYDLSWTTIILSLHDLTTGQMVGMFTLLGDQWSDWGMGGYSNYRSVDQILPWPAPPEPSTSLLTLWLSDENRFHDGGSGWATWDETYGTLYRTDLTAGGFTADSITNATSISPFLLPNPIGFSLSGEHHFVWQSDVGIEDWYDSCWVNEYSPATGLGLRNESFGCVTAVAQQDASGLRRTIIYDWWTIRALDPVSYTVFWQDSVARRPLYTAQLAGSWDERLLAYQTSSHAFRVYDASNGSYLDETSPIIGSIDHIIKRPGYRAEIVTHDDFNTVRVYGSAASTTVAPSGLTCRYLADSNLIRLNWTPVTSATRYYVYSSSDPSTVEIWEGTVVAPEHSFDLMPEDHKRFYFVTAEYGDGGTIGRARHAVPLRQTHAGRAR